MAELADRQSLAERYRPTTWEEVVGQNEAVMKLRRLVNRGQATGRAYWFSGESGTGKTTIARILASAVCEDLYVEEVNAGALTPQDVERLGETLRLCGGNARRGRAVIINEVHGLRRDTMRQLLVELEPIPAHAMWVFTTTRDGQQALLDDGGDIEPLMGRTTEIHLKKAGLCKAFAARAKQIAQAEGLDGRPLEEYEKLLKACHNSMRRALQAIDAGEMLSEEQLAAEAAAPPVAAPAPVAPPAVPVPPPLPTRELAL